MAIIQTFLVFFITILTAVVYMPFACVAFVLSFLGLKKPMAFFIYKIAQLWARLLILVTGCTLTVTGRENIPKRGGVCFVANHGSIFDIILALAYIGRPFGFIAKRELLLLPFINIWISILGGLFIDRSHPRKALKTINEGVRRLKAGGGVLVFPEGHRSKDGHLLPFHPGSFKLATHSAVPIVPIAIIGSRDVFEKYRRVNPGPVRLIFGVPLKTEDLPVGDRKQILANQVKGIIEKALAETPALALPS
jgi:1-acyl-sn-glycerol-3-phosphate acyltransferase